MKMDADMSVLVNELGHGHELATKLDAHLSSASTDLCKSLVHDILACLEKTMSMARTSAFIDSPQSFTSEDSKQLPFKVQRKETSKKRKTQSKWTTSQVKLGSGPEAEGPLEDGYSWRKYGQKEILGAKHPRGYYRCTHRNTQGCLAMKQVQRSEDNPSIFNVTYRGTHTCSRKSSPSTVATSSFPLLNQHDDRHLLLSFQTNLKVKTEILDSKVQEPACSSSFTFHGSKPESHVISPSSTAFFSPTTSESNYFSDFNEIASAETSATDSPLLDMDFLLPSSEMNTDFDLFDISSFFS
ncbi:uncharacterized protein A4U43_UnF8320 [Asparagus officinalis]|uniref:WRKY domain-containing protein n=1 Tax=Asparagus officinalis TaxID=4686 RepID=A0A1R3L607_ASPOF|nr:probable WRKY transcription factor 41 [Asparagus officinalis]ONK55038.1 uncharacterized protein A4U43_UnF8320 [Asparagus officinalis]